MNVARNYAFADVITYLPVDTASNAKEFLQIVRPKLAIFIKYDFWFHFLQEAKRQEIPLLLASAVFRKKQLFFKSYASFYREMLHLFQHIFVQDETSLRLLKEYKIEHCSVAGDTRFDRVSEIASEWAPIPMIDSFIANKTVLVAGSTWAGDEAVLDGCSVAKMIIAPHELDEPHLRHIENLFPQSIRYSKLTGDTNNNQVLIIDNVGMLSRLYQYATVAYVGGGFTKDGIHNVLEAAVYGKPVIIGPNYAKYREANELIEDGGAFSISDNQALQSRMTDLLHNEEALEKAAAAAKMYVEKNTGATVKIMAAIQEKRLLTS
jgi:3-deoxy-D-manno-octulosonic-acid transferase